MEYNFNLKDLNTFHLDCTAKEFLRLRNDEDLQHLHNIYGKEKIFVLGGGANTVFACEYFDGVVAKVENKGFSIVKEDQDNITLEVAGGEIWKDFVLWSCEKGYCGVENLAAIPGSVGAAPVQNIGAYGAEAKDCITEVLVYDMSKDSFRWFSNRECEFAYRYSCFKYQEGNLLIWKVRFSLKKHFTPNISYKALKDKLENMPQESVTPMLIAKMVTEIRDSKLPNPDVLGNAGSFFKNPVISTEQYERLKNFYPDIVAFDDEKGKKISAGWLIEQCGFKGRRVGNVGMHEKQALVLVNYGGATAEELINFAYAVIDNVKNRFDIELCPEAHIIK